MASDVSEKEAMVWRDIPEWLRAGRLHTGSSSRPRTGLVCLSISPFEDGIQNGSLIFGCLRTWTIMIFQLFCNYQLFLFSN
jgi:hypothetical protein